ncbi:MAG: response regulator transcription factor [Planctomycetia bacterium]|nr:response regulator transcription factor [Planctomycetia bacterium]
MGLRILVIEDEAEIADFILRGLREEGYVAEHAAEGNAAWTLMESSKWDLILLDWWLPGPDGLQLLHRLREKDLDTPVLFLTARDAVSDKVRGLDAGADDYVCKPFTFAELLARVRALTRRPRRGADTLLSFDDVQLDIMTQRAERAGHALMLTGKEYALLAFFMRHPREVLSRTRIYEQVWGERFDKMSNSLEVHVMELRRVLEAHGPRLIHTMRGRGYLLGTRAEELS